jgi:hypothetical protein
MRQPAGELADRLHFLQLATSPAMMVAPNRTDVPAVALAARERAAVGSLGHPRVR